jgi:hypothetical protein
MASSATTTCSGCLYGELNQLGHIDPGGCLYFEEEDLLDGGPSLAAGAAVPDEEPAADAALQEAPPQVVYLTAAQLEDEVVWPCRGIGVPPELWAQICPEGTVYRAFTRQQLEDVLGLPYQMGGTTPVTDDLWATLLEAFG